MTDEAQQRQDTRDFVECLALALWCAAHGWGHWWRHWADAEKFRCLLMLEG